MRKNKKIIILSILILALSFSCKSSNEPENTVVKMREAACNADVELFFSYIDKEYIENQYIEEVYGDPDSELSKEYDFLVKILAKLMIKYGEYFGYDFGDFFLDMIWEWVENDVKKGKDSDYCKLEVLGPGEKFNSVIVSTPEDGASEWTFKQSWGKYQLIDFGDPDIESEEVSEPDIHSEDDVEKLIDQAAEAKQKAKNEVDKSSGNENYDFRKTRWGMTVEQVKSSEDSEPYGDFDFCLFYTGEIAGKEASIYYLFTDNHLWRAGYLIEEEYDDNNMYINDFYSLKEILIEKYGGPDNYSEMWKDETYKDNPERYGKAVLEEHLSYSADWHLSDTSINLSLLGYDDEISLHMTYGILQ